MRSPMDDNTVELEELLEDDELVVLEVVVVLVVVEDFEKAEAIFLATEEIELSSPRAAPTVAAMTSKSYAKYGRVFLREEH